MPTGYTFPRKQCPVCKQMISIVQFFRHEGSKTCAEVARLNAKAWPLWAATPTETTHKK